MKTLNLIQGSDEWLSVRATCFTASEASAMMGYSKYQSRNDLLKMKATGISPEITSSQQYIFDKGHAAEAAARPFAESIIGDELYPVTALSDEHPKLLASFDGLTMMEEICWEHKLFNANLAANIQNDSLDLHYVYQLEQQLLVSGAEKCLFMCSDGTEENMEHTWYVSDDRFRSALLAGWAQFEKDLAAYVPTEVVVAAVGQDQKDLPALIVDIVGEVRSSNLATFKDIVLARIQDVKTDLKTDEDFATAELTVKFFSKAEKQLEAVKAQALGQTASIDELFKTVDHLKAEMRTKRLDLDKSVKTRKEAMKVEKVFNAKKAFAEHVEEINTGIGGFNIPSIPTDFAGVIKGKKLMTAIDSALADETARAKIEADKAYHLLNMNIDSLKELASDFKFLFSDARELVLLGNDHLQAEIKSRIAAHKTAEEKRLADQREQMRREEEAKATAKAKAKADEEAKAKRDEEDRLRKAAEVVKVAEDTVITGTCIIDTSNNRVAPEEFFKAPDPVSQAPRFAAPALKTAPLTVTITVAEHEQLLADSAFLQALKAAGVDNWSGYSEAQAAA